MNKITKNSIKWIIAIVILIGVKYAGDCEYNDAVLSSISQELYNTILKDLGGTASEKEVRDAYISKKEMYDKLGI